MSCLTQACVGKFVEVEYYLQRVAKEEEEDDEDEDLRYYQIPLLTNKRQNKNLIPVKKMNQSDWKEWKLIDYSKLSIIDPLSVEKHVTFLLLRLVTTFIFSCTTL